MSDKETVEKKDTTERRVYNLPADLLERLRAYQVSQGLTSEAEAARRLLDSALQMRDTVADILNTLGAKFAEEKDLRVLASEVLVKHALVENIKFKDGEVCFQLTNAERGRITGNGSLYYTDAPYGDDDWTSYLRRSNKTPPASKAGERPSWDNDKGGDLDDEIPF